ncbi:galactokinase [Rhizomonospora bruguierae]|uniref:galactokinase n=1 Tax=Rhizomonospora bruguierae TaxID=1581705 RepID=UPI001BCCCAE5|nr:galactokinase [Micromonospora sp. NBRC 107566]
MTGVAERAAAAFAERYGEPPAGVWAAPGRVNLIGEHTDYNNGFVLPFALPARTAVAAGRAGEGWAAWSEHAGGEPVRFGVDDLTPGAVQEWAAYVAGVVWSLRKNGHRPPGARLAIASDVPTGAGLSSSAALECAVLTALNDLGDLGIPEAARPALAQRAENDYVGVPCGIMDQTASVRCRSGHALLIDCGRDEVEQVPFDPAAEGLAMLVIDSRAPHQLVSGEYATRRKACEAGAAALGLPSLREVGDLDAALARLDDEVIRRRVRHVVTENQRVLAAVAALRAGRIRAIGPLLTASHASMREDFEITVPEVDTAVETALVAGAHGARMTGGGFGGCVIALVESGAAGAVGEAVREEFARRGFRPPAPFVTVPGAGAERIG